MMVWVNRKKIPKCDKIYVWDTKKKIKKLTDDSEKKLRG